MTAAYKMQRKVDVTSGESLARDEETINRAVWISRFLALALTAGVVGFFVITQADASWHYIAYPLLAGLPLAYGIVSARSIPRMHVDLLRRYQAHLMLRAIELEKMASHDGLTELYNRRYFYERFQEGVARARASRQTLALIILDIAGLKKINDEYGHVVGDVMIASLAKVIEKHIRTSDVPARLGGDEFAIHMADTDKRRAFALAQRLWQEAGESTRYRP